MSYQIQQKYQMYALETSIFVRIQNFGLFCFDQSTLLLRDRWPLLNDEPKILAALHQGVQYILINNEIYQFRVDGNLSL
jgi:hypothetical protein